MPRRLSRRWWVSAECHRTIFIVLTMFLLAVLCTISAFWFSGWKSLAGIVAFFLFLY
jgi:hypothetical protein